MFYKINYGTLTTVIKKIYHKMERWIICHIVPIEFLFIRYEKNNPPPISHFYYFHFCSTG